MSGIFNIESISQVHQMIGIESPSHPLISLVETARIGRQSMPESIQKVSSSMYMVSLKNGHECRINYGRQSYDFQEGTLIFLAPDQVITPMRDSQVDAEPNLEGWVLFFHPDLIRKSPLGRKIKEYSFFNYASHEALHISNQERTHITDIAMKIRHEYSQNMDSFSQELILSNLELLLNYCKRFYGRQFLTRCDVHKDVVIRFEKFLEDHFGSSGGEFRPLPTVKQCADMMGYTPNYLSDLLRQETGKNTREHIHLFVIEKAKNMLLGTENTVSQIAYALGFDYPQHFSKLFKDKTGLSPAAYRN